MTTRRSSIYSLRVRTLKPSSTLDSLIVGLAHTGTLRQDSHVRAEDGRTHAAVGFRAAGDDEARRIASEVIDHAGLDPLSGVTMITGFGSARREVEL